MFNQRNRQAWGAQPTRVHDDVVADVRQTVERLSEVGPHPTEVAGASGLAEARKEQPAVSMVISERFTLIQHHLAKWAAVTVRFRYPEQTLASGRSASQVSGQYRLLGARIAVSQ